MPWDITDVISVVFTMFLHPRTGTLLRKSEVDILSLITRPNFRKGELVVYRRRNREYVWAIYQGNCRGNKCEIITSPSNSNIDMDNLIISNVSKTSLYPFPKTEIISATTEGRNNLKLDDEQLIETYKL